MFALVVLLVVVVRLIGVFKAFKTCLRICSVLKTVSK